MTFMNRFRRMFPTKQVDVKELERKPAVVLKTGSMNTVHKETEEFDGVKMLNGEYEIVEREILPEQIFCPDCGGYTLEGLDFCDKCGGDLSNV